MKLESKYNIDDTVYHIQSNPPIIVKCKIASITLSINSKEEKVAGTRRDLKSTGKLLPEKGYVIYSVKYENGPANTVYSKSESELFSSKEEIIAKLEDKVVVSKPY